MLVATLVLALETGSFADLDRLVGGVKRSGHGMSACEPIAGVNPICLGGGVEGWVVILGSGWLLPAVTSLSDAVTLLLTCVSWCDTTLCSLARDTGTWVSAGMGAVTTILCCCCCGC